MTTLEVRPFEGAGAEILGADISAMSSGEWDQIEAAFASFGLLVFRDQILTEQEHVEFAQRWGASLQPRSNIHGVFPEIAVSPTRSTGEAEQGVWHSELSYLPTPPLASIEVVRGQPAAGASTKFASTYSAFDALSTATQQALEALSASHQVPESSVLGACLWSAPLAGRGPVTPSAHPIVIHHTISGRKTLFVNPTFTTSVVDMDEAAGLALLNQLYEHCQQPEFTVTVEWDPGTVILWDTRAMLHFNTAGQEQPLTHRITIAGTPLRPALSQNKADPSLTQRAGATLAGGILTAAMTGIAEVIHPERAKQDIEIVSEAPDPEDLPELDFGELPPLD